MTYPGIASVGLDYCVKDMFVNIVNKIKSDPNCSIPNGTPNFYYGYWDEIAKNIMIKNQSTYAFPAIILHASISSKEGLTYRYSGQISPTIYIVTQTNPNWSALDRIENSYKKVLYPLQERFIFYTKYSHYFNLWENGKESIKNSSSDMLFFTGEPKSQNKLNDFIDAIEIKFDGLKILKRINYNI